MTYPLGIKNSFSYNMSYSNICLLCLQHSDDLFKIYGKRGIELNAGSTLEKHFWFEVRKSDERSICEKCWWTVQNFHDFYNSVKNNHKEYESSFDIEVVIVDSDEDNEIWELLDVIKNEPSIDNKNDSDIPDSLDSRASESFVEPEVKSGTVDANEHNEIVELLKNIKNEPSVDLENNIDCSSDIPDSLDSPAVESYKKPELNWVIKLPKIKRKKPPPTYRYKTDAHSSLLSTYFNMSCDLCDTHLSSFHDTKQHFRNVHNNKNGYLICCRRKYFRLSHMLQHCQYHTNPNSFQCEHCPKTFLDNDAFRRHLNLNHPPDNEKLFSCNNCDRIFSKKHLLRAHMKSGHRTVPPKKRGRKPLYNCDITVLKSNMKKVHQTEFSHICELCAKSFTSRKAFEMHYLDCHTDISQKVQCDICGKWLKHKGCLSKHFYSHYSKKVTCTICGRVSRNRVALLVHIRVTHAEPSLECVVCGKKFKKPKVLKEHMAIHAGITDLYKCTFCTKTCRSSANMYSHEKRAHPIELEKKKALLLLQQYR